MANQVAAVQKDSFAACDIHKDRYPNPKEQIPKTPALLAMLDAFPLSLGVAIWSGPLRRG